MQFIPQSACARNSWKAFPTTLSYCCCFLSIRAFVYWLWAQQCFNLWTRSDQIFIQGQLTEFLLFLAAYYLKYLKTPYFIFVRDALSYLALVGLHYAFCLSPSSLAFSGLEWSILIFFTGRFLVEYRQVRLIVKRIEERRKSGKDETHSNVLQKALCSYIRWIY